MTAQLVEPVDVMLVAEHSGKWPKDAQAVRRVRLRIGGWERWAGN